MTTPNLSSPPAAPQRSDPSTFSARADAFLGWWSSIIIELNAFITWVSSIADSITATSNFWSAANALSGNTVDCSVGVYFTKIITGATTFSFSNIPASGKAYSCTLRVTHTSGTITWPSSVRWSEDAPPILLTGKVHVFVLMTDDGGANWRATAAVNFAG